MVAMMLAAVAPWPAPEQLSRWGKYFRRRQTYLVTLPRDLLPVLQGHQLRHSRQYWVVRRFRWTVARWLSGISSHKKKSA
mmetsp:Transcript_96219/g.244491  ORF Transcript_96219/g.244491 Transcript_96219/m.244491 type:complete len:80 (+) Transcript_96219:95-334(+)